MFHQHKFVCVDPAPFHRFLQGHERLHLRQEQFTDALAKEYIGENVLFISDIRSCDWTIMDEKKVKQRVDIDQEAQMRWVELMKPCASILKFRLPWEAGTTKYLAGDIYFPIWGPITTTEARLMTTGGFCDYDNKAYEEQMFHFNTVRRVARYNHDVKGEGIDHCYDCMGEILILKDYLNKIRHIPLDSEQMNDTIAEWSKGISSSLGNRSLQDGNLDPKERTQGIQKRQWIDGKPAYFNEPVAQQSINIFSKSPGVSKMMKSMGYMEGKGLGKDMQGMVTPIQVEKRDNSLSGLGFKDQGFRFERSKVDYFSSYSSISKTKLEGSSTSTTVQTVSSSLSSSSLSQMESKSKEPTLAPDAFHGELVKNKKEI
eukprot:m.76665 g.76665  ORF g.76665 m.76665 type:complete len:372 (-) comp8521_c2_seq7:136-1251(-)